MERLTYDFALGGNHCWQVKGADNLECREVCQRQEDKGCKDCPIAKAFDRLAAIEDILGDEYDLERLKELIKQTGGAKPMGLIDADAIKINYGGLAHIGPYDYEEISKYYLDQIKKQPTVDAALVIRCRECKYGKKSACMPGMVYCQAIHKYKTQNGYCDEGGANNETNRC